MRPVTFVGLTDYQKPYTRVRCYHFARALHSEFAPRVFSFQEHLTGISDGKMMLELPVRERVRLNAAAFRANIPWRRGLLYLQKVHYHAAFVRWYQQCFDTPYILDYDDYDFDRSPLFTPGLNRLLLGAADPTAATMLMARRARCVVVSSQALQRYFSATCETHVIPTGVDTDAFMPVAGPERDTVTFVWCGMVWGEVIHDNVCWMAECFRAILPEFPQARLVLAGDGDWYDRVRERYAGVREISCRGYLDPGAMAGFLAAADAGLLPLLPDAANREWFAGKSPTKLFEYMACGLPTVASRCGEAERIISDGQDGYLCRDAQEFTQALRRLAADATLRRVMGAKARRRAEAEYSLPVLMPRLAAILRRHGAA